MDVKRSAPDCAGNLQFDWPVRWQWMRRAAVGGVSSGDGHWRNPCGRYTQYRPRKVLELSCRYMYASRDNVGGKISPSARGDSWAIQPKAKLGLPHRSHGLGGQTLACVTSRAYNLALGLHSILISISTCTLFSCSILAVIHTSQYYKHGISPSQGSGRLDRVNDQGW
jgi:hypothetical protein